MGTVVIGGNTYNVYGSQADAIIYATGATHLAAFLAAVSDDQKRLLVTATRMIDRQCLLGTPASASPPALHFPATGIDATLALNGDGVPVIVEYATYELAASLLSNAAVQTQANTGSNLASFTNRVEGAVTQSQSFFRDTLRDSPRFPTIVQELLKPLLCGGTLSLTAFSGEQCESGLESFGFNPNGIP